MIGIVDQRALVEQRRHSEKPLRKGRDRIPADKRMRTLILQRKGQNATGTRPSSPVLTEPSVHA